MRTSRRSRDERQAETRARLIECAHRVLLRNGFHAATLDQIALADGVTKGAVYSNFDGKAALFLAVSGARMEERVRGYQRVRATATRLEQLVREFARIMIRYDPDGRWASVVAEAWAVAASDEPFRAALIAQSARGNTIITDAVAELADRGGIEFRLPIAKMNMLCTALMRGMLLQRLLDPAAVSRELIEETLIAVIHSMVQRRARSEQGGDHDRHFTSRSGGRAAARRGSQRQG
jgi:AcrR family transcriptional regulator